MSDSNCGPAGMGSHSAAGVVRRRRLGAARFGEGLSEDQQPLREKGVQEANRQLARHTYLTRGLTVIKKAVPLG